VLNAKSAPMTVKLLIKLLKMVENKLVQLVLNVELKNTNLYLAEHLVKVQNVLLVSLVLVSLVLVNLVLVNLNQMMKKKKKNLNVVLVGLVPVKLQNVPHEDVLVNLGLVNLGLVNLVNVPHEDVLVSLGLVKVQNVLVSLGLVKVQNVLVKVQNVPVKVQNVLQEDVLVGLVNLVAHISRLPLWKN
jgi:hypothetical protein